MDSQFMSSDESESGTCWIEWFQSQRGNEFFCCVDEDFILDRFNLAGLAVEVKDHYQLALDLICDTLEEDMDPGTWDIVDRAARHLYGMIHARWILTNKGVMMMAEKMKRKEFGRCPRVFCDEQPVIPVGLSDVPGQKGVKLYCPKCEDVYSPPSKKQQTIDGAYFPTSFPHLVLQMYPSLNSENNHQRYVPRIFGFKVHSIAEDHRMQDKIRELTVKKQEDLMHIEE